jgi:hypothetical protein
MVRKRQQSVLGRVAVRTRPMLILLLLIDGKTQVQRMRMGCSMTLSYLSSPTTTVKTHPKTASKFPRTRIQLLISKNSGSRPLVPRVVHDVECDPDPGRAPRTEGPQLLEGEDNYSESYWNRRSQWIKDTRKVVLPEPGGFRPLEEPPLFDLRKDFAANGLQVIVKLANIQLTPEKPEYEGGTWHVEGQLVGFLL